MSDCNGVSRPGSNIFISLKRYLGARRIALALCIRYEDDEQFWRTAAKITLAKARSRSGLFHLHRRDRSDFCAAETEGLGTSLPPGRNPSSRRGKPFSEWLCLSALSGSARGSVLLPFAGGGARLVGAHQCCRGGSLVCLCLVFVRRAELPARRSFRAA